MQVGAPTLQRAMSDSRSPTGRAMAMARSTVSFASKPPGSSLHTGCGLGWLTSRMDPPTFRDFEIEMA